MSDIMTFLLLSFHSFLSSMYFSSIRVCNSSSYYSIAMLASCSCNFLVISMLSVSFLTWSSSKISWDCFIAAFYLLVRATFLRSLLNFISNSVIWTMYLLISTSYKSCWFLQVASKSYWAIATWASSVISSWIWVMALSV
jgi:hypothetical protein